MTAPLLTIRELTLELPSDQGPGGAILDRVHLTVGPGEAVGLVGESGCGKSLLARSIMGLTQGLVPSGEIHFAGRDLGALSPPERRKLRGAELAMIFQEPGTALNPVYRIGAQLLQVVARHRPLWSAAQVERHCQELLRLVQLPDVPSKLRAYPHELSGGQLQRVLIGMALSCEPRILIADEPTSALDVTAQAEIIAVLRRLQQRFGMATLLISHDLYEVAEFCHRVYVLYCGRVVEEAPVARLFRHPRHPYTKGLLDATPRLDDDLEVPPQPVPGSAPAAPFRFTGCAFAERCPRVQPRCRQERPALRNGVACFFPLAEGESP